MFGSVEDLRTFLRDPSLDGDICTAALMDATGFIRAMADQTITLVTDDVELVEVRSNTDTFVLSEFPVVAVSKIELYSDTTGLWTVMEPNRYRWLESGVVRRTGTGYWPFGFGRIQVTYTHGYAVINNVTPPGLWGVAVAMAARRTVNAQDRVSLRIGGYAEVFNRLPGGPILATDAEAKIIASFRSPHAA